MLQTVAAKSTPAMTREELLSRAEALVPVLAARSADCEKARMAPAATIADYVDNGLLRICQPARYGGFDLGYDVMCEVTQTLARGCGSQAWVHMVLADNPLKLAAFDLRAQDDVWGEDSDLQDLRRHRRRRQGASRARRHRLDGRPRLLQRHRPRGLGDLRRQHLRGGQAAGRLLRADPHLRHQYHRRLVLGRPRRLGQQELRGEGRLRAGASRAVEEGLRCRHLARHPALQVRDFRSCRAAVSRRSATRRSASASREGFLESYLQFTGPRKSRGNPVADGVGVQMGVGQASAEIEAASRMYLGVVRETMQRLERNEDRARS